MISRSSIKGVLPILILFTATAVRVSYFLLKNNPQDLAKKSSGTYYIHPKLEEFITQTKLRVQDTLPKTHADLLLGMTIGVDAIKEEKSFNQMLITTGLVHVVVVSGYNVGLVIKFMNSIFYNRLKSSNKGYIALFLGIYVIVCGLQAPVIRAAIMGYVVYLASTEGRGLAGIYLLVFVCLCMLLVYPIYILSLSFWLSTSATLGLMIFQKGVQGFFDTIFSDFQKIYKYLPIEDLSTSLACQVTVWPIIAYFFGRLSLASPIYNMLVLWLIPICTILGFIYLLVLFFLPVLSNIFMYLLLPFYDTFVRLVQFFDSIDKGSVSVGLTAEFFVGYYAVLFALIIVKPFFTKSLPSAIQ